MSWEAISALGSIVAALILLGGTIAALIQLKHLRMANQIESYLQIFKTMNSPEMVDARAFVESHDFSDPKALAGMIDAGLDSRIVMYGGFCQTVARLINQRICDPVLFAPFTLSVIATWKSLRPITYALRARTPGNMRFLDIEALVYKSQENLTYARISRGYPRALLERVGFEQSLAEARRKASEAFVPDVG